MNTLKNVFLLSILHIGLSSLAQTDSTYQLGEVEISEKRLSQLPFQFATRNITVISQADLRQMPVQSVAEALSYISGIDLRQRGPWGAQGDLTMLGSTFEQVLVLINGIPMRDPQTGHHQMNLPIDLSQIARIEVMKGSAARIYGANALAGAINIVTIDPGSQKVFVQAYGGSNLTTTDDWSKPYGMAGGRASVGLRSKGGNSGHQIDAAFFRTDGYRYNSSNTQQRINYLGRVDVGNGKLNLMGGFNRNAFGANGYYAYPWDGDAFETVETTFGGIHYERLAGAWTLRPLAYLRYNHDDYIFIRQDPAVYRNNHFTTATGAEFHASRGNALGHFGVGYESRAELIRSNNLGRHERYFQSIYAEQRFEWSNSTLLTVGANVQYNSDYGFRVYPGIELSAPLFSGMRFFAQTGLGTRFPTYTDLFYSDRANIGNSDLEPEEAVNGEAGLKWAEGGMRAQVSGFIRQTDGFIDFVRENDTLQWQPRNFQRVTIHGIEAQGSYTFEKREGFFQPLLIRTQYTYLNGEVRRGELLNKYSLDNLTHQLSSSLIFRTSRFLEHTMAVRYLERFNGMRYAVCDYRLRVRAGNWSLTADATNLLDREFVESGFIPMPGRWFRMGVEWRL